MNINISTLSTTKNIAKSSNINPFIDVKENDWFYNDVIRLYDKKLFFGVSENKFAPNKRMTRGMIAMVLYRLEGTPKINTIDSLSFDDIMNGAWYMDAVGWASKNNFVFGFGDGIFKPNHALTREQLTTILYRHSQKPDTEISLEDYYDFDKISDWAVNSMAWAIENEIIFPDENTCLLPKKKLTRARACSIIVKYILNKK